eukprot:1136362-Pelagomonas_calceolata.AAC.9
MAPPLCRFAQNNATALMAACTFGHVQAAELLLDHGAYINAQTKVRLQTPFVQARTRMGISKRGSRAVRPCDVHPCTNQGELRSAASVQGTCYLATEFFFDSGRTHQQSAAGVQGVLLQSTWERIDDDMPKLQGHTPVASLKF